MPPSAGEGDATGVDGAAAASFASCGSFRRSYCALADIVLVARAETATRGDDEPTNTSTDLTLTMTARIVRCGRQ
jgi:hypothetical protein|eukprot:30551-Pelagococcus_subviridis.AAC.7